MELLYIVEELEVGIELVLIFEGTLKLSGESCQFGDLLLLSEESPFLCSPRLISINLFDYRRASSSFYFSHTYIAFYANYFFILKYYYCCFLSIQSSIFFFYSYNFCFIRTSSLFLINSSIFYLFISYSKIYLSRYDSSFYFNSLYFFRCSYSRRILCSSKNYFL